MSATAPLFVMQFAMADYFLIILWLSHGHVTYYVGKK